MSDLAGIGPDLWEATVQTIVMVLVSTALAVVAGIPLGVLLVVTGPGGLAPRPGVYRVVGFAVNVGRSVPFIILLVAVLPITRALVGTTIGPAAAIVPLTLAAVPFLGRLVENALREVHPGKIEAALAMGSRQRDVITKVLLAESRAAIVAATTVTLVALVGYSAMAGAVGGGGLGDFAIRWGYQRFRTDITIVTVVILVALVQAFQYAGDSLARRLAHR